MKIHVTATFGCDLRTYKDNGSLENKVSEKIYTFILENS